MKKICIYLLLLFLGNVHLYAQFLGGPGSGHSFSVLTQTSVSASVIFNAFGGGSGDGQADATVAQLYLDGSSVSAMFGGGVSDGETAAEISGISFATFPIVLASFEAIPGRQGIELRWTAILEMPGSQFVIERSVDGQLFQAILPAIRPSASTGLYQGRTFDTMPLMGRSYYRLKMTEPSGWMAYSNTQSVWVDNGEWLDFDIFPNPSVDGAFLKLNLNPRIDLQKGLELEVLDVFGKRKLHKMLLASSLDASTLEIHFTHRLSAGLYFVRMYDSYLNSISKPWLVK